MQQPYTIDQLQQLYWDQPNPAPVFRTIVRDYTVQVSHAGFPTRDWHVIILNPDGRQVASYTRRNGTQKQAQIEALIYLNVMFLAVP